MTKIIVAKHSGVEPVVHPNVNRFFTREENGEKIFCVEKPVNETNSRSRIVFEYPFDEIAEIAIIPE